MPAAFPALRLRRLRRTGALRDLVRETTLAPSDLVLPLFVQEGLEGGRDRLDAGRPPPRDRLGRRGGRRRPGARSPGGHPLQASRPRRTPTAAAPGTTTAPCSSPRARSRPRTPTVVVITDVCLCEYTDHGHCGRLLPDGTVDNDASLELLARTAVSHARAGADAVAPAT